MPSNKKDTTISPLSLDARATAVFATSRTESVRLVGDATAHADSVHAALARMREQHEANRCDLPARITTDGVMETIHALRAAHSQLLDEVAPRRIHTVDITKSILQQSEVGMRKSRKRLVEKTKTNLDDAREKQKLATDASALVKHYKALILEL